MYKKFIDKKNGFKYTIPAREDLFSLSHTHTHTSEEFFTACHSVRSKFTVSVSYYARRWKNCGKLAKHMVT